MEISYFGSTAVVWWTFWHHLSITFWHHLSITFWHHLSITFWHHLSITFWHHLSITFWHHLSITFWHHLSITFWHHLSITFWHHLSITFWHHLSITFWHHLSITFWHNFLVVYHILTSLSLTPCSWYSYHVIISTKNPACWTLRQCFNQLDWVHLLLHQHARIVLCIVTLTLTLSQSHASSYATGHREASPGHQVIHQRQARTHSGISSFTSSAKEEINGNVT